MYTHIDIINICHCINKHIRLPFFSKAAKSRFPVSHFWLIVCCGGHLEPSVPDYLTFIAWWPARGDGKAPDVMHTGTLTPHERRTLIRI